MNYVDIVLISIVVLSALLAFMRGFVREILGIGAWIAAGFFAVWAFPFVREHFRGWITQPDIADMVGMGSLFVAALLILSIVTGIIGGLVRTSVLGGLDRTLGLVFGFVRGVGALAIAYIVVGLVVPLERWPDAVLEARTLPFVYYGAVLGVSLVPEDYRPVVHIAPGAHETKAADLLSLKPKGLAIGKP